MANIILISTNQIADILYAKDKYIQAYGTLCSCYLFLSIEPSIYNANLSQQFTYIHVCFIKCLSPFTSKRSHRDRNDKQNTNAK